MATAKIQATINGRTMTLAEVTVPDTAGITSGAVGNSQTISLALTHAIKVDPATAINLVTVQGATASAASATIHYVEEAIDGV